MTNETASGSPHQPSFVVEPTTRWTAEEREALWNDSVAEAEAAGRGFSFTA